MKEKTLYCNKTFDKTEIRKLIEWFTYNYGSIKTNKLLDKLKLNGFNYATKAGISLGLEDLKIPKIKKTLINNTEKDIGKSEFKLKKGKINTVQHAEKITKSWSITNDLLKNEIIINLRQTDLLNPVYMMTFSGARGNISQIRQLIGMRGLMSDSQGQIINLPIKNNLKEGLKITEYFISCNGARKGLVDTALKTANSGYLTRRLIYASQSQKIRRPNCNSNNGIMVVVNKNNKEKYKSTLDVLIGRVLARNITNENKDLIVFQKGQDICRYIAKKIIKTKKIYIRSPLTCRLNMGVCQLCYGWDLGNGRIAQLGESVGILAAQSIGEPGTQLTMRTFHTGGVFAGEVVETINAPENGIVNYNSKFGGKKIETKYGEKAFFTLKEKRIELLTNTNIKSVIKVPKYTILFTKPNKKVFRKQIIGEFSTLKSIKNIKDKSDKQQKEIRTEISGKVNIHKKNEKKDSIWITSGNIISFQLINKALKSYEIKKKKFSLKETKYKTKNEDIKISTNTSTITLNTLKKLNKFNKLKINKSEIEKNYIVEKINKKNKKIFVKKQTVEKVILKQKKSKANNIKEYINIKRDFNEKPAQIIEIQEKLIIVRKGKPNFVSEMTKINVKNNTLIKKNNVIYYTIYKKQKTEDIVEGLPKIEELIEAKRISNLETIKSNTHDKLKKTFQSFEKKYKNSIAVKKSIEKIQTYLINKIQRVYSAQSVKIANKHMEIVVKQMTSRVIVIDRGDSEIITGEIIELNKLEKTNKTLENQITYEPIIIGITKLSLSNQSFISEASFQETTRVLTRSAVEGKIDWLYGLKENIILGNLIPIGTGYKKSYNI
uniref:DNA-directed RNA polymerase n=1 Tax=Monomorphina parapyrum TaxID=1664066 RepID=A0A0G3VGX8_9EUGL|nr:RNA polymerase beta'' subunit [Monomorphina parapyrum]AKL78919.1 RNA polymerase beta'' subunit [Monomorphina parapyrum]